MTNDPLSDPLDSQALRPAVVTVWFVTAAEPVEVFNAEPDYDRGFGRKFLAFFDQSLPVTPIGDFPLNRSAEAGAGEFYIGGFDGVAVVQTLVEDASKLSLLDERLRTGISATDVFAVVSDNLTGFGAFAHWRAGALKRAFSATPYRILEDEGLPVGCEGDFWAGRHRPELLDAPSTHRSGVGLPFLPAELTRAVIAEWLGFDPYQSAPDIPVCAFAVDGRRVAESSSVKRPRRGLAFDNAAETEGEYDDYELHEPLEQDEVREGLTKASRAVVHTARTVGSGLKKTAINVWRSLDSARKRR